MRQRGTQHAQRRARKLRSPGAGFLLSSFPFCLALLLLPACVTERVTPTPRRGIPVPPAPTSSAPPSPSRPLPDPSTPIARPVPSAETQTSRVTVALRPLGRIPYDGLCLPLVSPDGRFIAVQTGSAPDWDAVLARPNSPPVTSGLAIYRITDTALEPVTPAALLPRGLILGRSADANGFLVESPREGNPGNGDHPGGGGRWIGHVSWTTGALTWLVATDDTNAHAILTAGGDLLYTRTPAPTPGSTPARTSLVLRTPTGQEAEWTPESGVPLFPVAAADPTSAAVFVGDIPGPLQLVALHISRDPATGAPQLLAGAVRRLTAAATPTGAYQATAPLQIPLPGDPSRSPRIPIFDPGRAGGQMGLFDPLTGELSTFPPGSIAAVPVPPGTRTEGAGEEREGYLVAAPRGLFYFPPGTAGTSDPNPSRPDRALNVVAGAQLPRTTNSQGRVLLFAPPAERVGFVYEVSVMLLGPDTDQEPAERR